MSTKKKLLEAAAGNAGGEAVYVDDMFSAFLYEGRSQRTRIRNNVKLGDGPENGTQLHLTGDNLTDSAPVVSTITNNNSVAVSTSVKKYGTGSIEFNSGSANQTLQFDQSSDMKFPDGKSDFTVEGWIYMGETGSFRTMFSLGVPFQLYINNNTVTLYIAETISSSYVSGLNPLNGTTNAITTGAWHHVAVVRHGDEFSVYTNGTRTTPVTYSGNVHVGPTGTIGGYTSTQYLFAPGSTSNYIDDFRISDRAVYTDNFTPPSSAHSLDTLVTGEGGLVWTKGRDYASYHILHDTERGKTKYFLLPDTSASQTDSSGALISSFNNDGYSLGTAGTVNTSGRDYASWTFRKQPGFFDVVTFSDSGSSQTNRRISHNLGSVPGMIIIKKTSGTGAWFCYHRSTGVDSYLILNMTAAESTGSNFWGTAPTSSDFGINEANLGISGDYVAYLFAHDAQDFGTNSDESIIKCGSYTTNASAEATVNLGFEPQWLMIKATSDTGNWVIVDNIRGIAAGVGGDTANDQLLFPNGTFAESTQAAIELNPTGFRVKSNSNIANGGTTYAYVAIRRPHKPAEEFAATELFGMDTWSAASGATPQFTSGFPVDMAFWRDKDNAGAGYTVDRLRGTKYLEMSSTAAEATSSIYKFDYMTGYGSSPSTYSTIQSWMFRRAPGFFDVVAYTGTGGTGTHTHNLGVVPELMIVKGRSVGSNWAVYAAPLGNTKLIELDNTGAAWTNSIWGNTTPTASVATIGGAANLSGSTYIAYLFATVPGISKVGSYTGTGSNVDVDCGFTSGARFVLAKRTDSTGDWYVWDSERGIVAGNDPYLLLNSTAAQVTSTDYIDPLSSGFTITSSAPAALNTSGGTYLFLAIA